MSSLCSELTPAGHTGVLALGKSIELCIVTICLLLWNCYFPLKVQNKELKDSMLSKELNV